MAYQRLLIQKGEDTVIDTGAKFGIYVSESPHLPVPTEIKNIYTQEWKDENGKERYFPIEPKYKEVKFEIDFITKGSIDIVKANIRSFIAYITNSYIKIYDEYTGIGRQNVCYAKYKEKDYINYEEGLNHIVTFSLEFEIDDPVTDVKLELI